METKYKILVDVLYPPSAPMIHRPVNLLKAGKQKQWAIDLVKNLSYNGKERIWRRYELKGSQPLYAYFHNSQNWGNGGDTTCGYSNSISFAKRNANRRFDNWYYNILKENAETHEVAFIEICFGVAQVSLVPTNLELASWLSEQFEFNEFKPVTSLQKADEKIMAVFKDGGQVEVKGEEEIASIFDLGGIIY